MRLTKVVWVLGASALLFAGSHALFQERKVIPYDAKRESASARSELDALYTQLHTSIEKGDLNPAQDIFDTYFEVHNNLAGLGKDDDYQDYAEWAVEIEKGDSAFHWAGPDVSQSRVKWKLNSLVSGRRFATAFIETTQTCQRQLNGKTVKAEIRTQCVDVWHRQEAISSKATTAYEWRMEYREIVALEVKMDGKSVPIEMGG